MVRINSKLKERHWMPDRLWLRINLYLVLCLSIGFISFNAKLSLYHPIFESHHVANSTLALSLNSKMEVSERFDFNPDLAVVLPAGPLFSLESDISFPQQPAPKPILHTGTFASFWFKRPPPSL
jgi:hypothetical protein